MLPGKLAAIVVNGGGTDASGNPRGAASRRNR